MIKENKRERLIESAKMCIYQQGFYRTTLADVAEASGVPLGNVYYHFRTKDALMQAVIETHLREVQESFTRWEQHSDPLERLKALARSSRSFSEQMVRYGCPYGSLCQELEKDENQLAHAATELLRIHLDWAERQFCLLGKGEAADDLAVDLISSMQGAYLLSYSLRSSQLLDQKIERLVYWLDTL